MKYKKYFRTIRIAFSVIVMTAAVAAFSGICVNAATLFQLQFGPALMRCFSAFSAGALTVLLGICLATFLFGRFYCAVFCPLGIFQDAAGFLSRRRGGILPNCVKTRYAIAGVVCGLLFCGWNAGFLLLDPYSIFGRVFSPFSLGLMIPLLLIAVFAVWKKRIFCTSVCPVGTLLGLIARFCVFRLRISEKCVHCGRCASVCPSGCVDPKAGTIDNERCVRCMNCISVCPPGAIVYSGPEKDKGRMDVSRRAFLVKSGMLLAGFAAGAALAKTGAGKISEIARRFRILPPGAGDSERFFSKCTACQLCVENCPEKIIVPSPVGIGPVSLDLSRGSCKFDCNICSGVCPAGALAALPIAVKQKTKIAEARFNPRFCIVFQEGKKCGLCAAACPVHAVTLRKNGTPRPVDLSLCIGCGACQYVCPPKEKAITVHEIEKQIQLK